MTKYDVVKILILFTYFFIILLLIGIILGVVICPF